MQEPRKYLSVKQYLALHPEQFSKNFLYDKIREGVIPSVRIGRKVLIPSDALDQLLGEALKKEG